MFHVPDKLLQMALAQIDAFRDFQDRVDSNADAIFDILCSKSKYEISRGRIMGTVGVDSPLETFNQTQFDLVIFVNDQSPPFHHVLDDFEDVLCKKFNKNVRVYFKSRTECSLELRMKDISQFGYHFVEGIRENKYVTFGLYPAVNLLSAYEEKQLNLNREKLQTGRMLKWMSEIPPSIRNSSASDCYKSSFVEGYIDFVNKQSEFVHHVIRLGKLWNRKITWSENEYEITEKLEGRSKIIELVAIRSALNEELDARVADRDPSIFKALKQFLDKFIHFDQLMHEVFYDNECDYSEVPLQAFWKTVNSSKYPVILDPVNPFDNLAMNVSKEMKQAFKSHAKFTLSAIKQLNRIQSWVS